MKTRKLGKTAWDVSEIGFGAWGIGKTWWGETDDDASIQALQAAWEAGITFYDTAYVYGDGHSEALIAKALKGKPALVATKIPPKNYKWPPDSGDPIGAAFPTEWIVSCTERSLKKLDRDTVDLTQFHVWKDDWLKEDSWKKAVERLKKAGKIRAFGLSINDHDPNSALEAVQSGFIDTVQVIFNIFEQAPRERLFPLCQKHNVGVIARVPFDEGCLTGTFTRDTKFIGDDFRAQYFGEGRLAEAVERAERLKPFLKNGIKTLPELALKFILSHEAVSVVIPGMRTAAHAKANAAVSEGPGLGPSVLEALRTRAWKKNFYEFWD